MKKLLALLFFYNTRRMRTILTAFGILASTAVYACPSQIITLPDGRTVVCFYCNGGKIVNCEKL